MDVDSGGASPMRSIVTTGSESSASCCGCSCHSRLRAHHCRNRSRFDRALFKLGRRPPLKCTHQCITLGRATENVHNTFAMMGKHRMNSQPAPIAAAIGSRQFVPQLQPLIVKAKIALALKLCRRMNPIDMHALPFSAAQCVTLGRG